MSIAFWCVFIAAVLPYFPALVAKVGGTGYDNNEPRTWLAKQHGFRARANAAQQNSFEAFGFFAVAVLVAHAVHGPMVSVNTAAHGVHCRAPDLHPAVSGRLGQGCDR